MKLKTESIPKRTILDAEDVPDQYERRGFVHACEYGTIKPEPNEFGGIFVRVRNARLAHGIWVQDAECVERLFVRPNV